MSFDHNTKTTTEVVPAVGIDPNQQQQPTNFNNPILLNEMLQNKELLTCYKCKETFAIEENDNQIEGEEGHPLESNNILLGIILNKRTPSSICFKCLSRKMMDVITEQFTKNSKDYEGMFFSYEHKFKV